MWPIYHLKHMYLFRQEEEEEEAASRRSFLTQPTSDKVRYCAGMQKKKININIQNENCIPLRDTAFYIFVLYFKSNPSSTT